MITGEIIYFQEDEVDTLTPFYVKLERLPDASCKKCYGRFHMGKNIKTDLYIPCTKCKKKCIDWEAYKVPVDVIG